jgi:hypothetical protein
MSVVGQIARRGRAQRRWVRFDEALAWIAEWHPGQVPQKYGCKTWPQVLSESGASGSSGASDRLKVFP